MCSRPGRAGDGYRSGRMNDCNWPATSTASSIVTSGSPTTPAPLRNSPILAAPAKNLLNGYAMPRLRTLDPGTSPLHFFGAEVRHARSAAGMSQAELGAAAHCDGSVVSRIEAGIAEPPAGFPEACDAAFPERGGFFTRFWRDHQGWGGPYPPSYLDWLGIEREAAVLRMWEPMLIPGLLPGRRVRAGDLLLLAAGQPRHRRRQGGGTTRTAADLLP